MFLGYNEKYKGYRCVYPPTGRFYISRHVLFEESDFPFADIYAHCHSQSTIALLYAWQQGFLSPYPREVPLSNASNQTPGPNATVTDLSSSPSSSQQGHTEQSENSSTQSTNL